MSLIVREALLEQCQNHHIGGYKGHVTWQRFWNNSVKDQMQEVFAKHTHKAAMGPKMMNVIHWGYI